ncbi:MAG: hypothetical protein HWE22_09125 [Flavobacteriales bacterium]|nr:hypothetical protein [Flavobacteriales bacterium]
MKNIICLLFLLGLGTYSFAQDIDSTGMEGDNLDLNGVLELFKESKDVEDFEKKLNTESNGVNNLDLNQDGEVDYIRVVDYADSNAHSLALQVPVTETESQDVAVIEMEEVEEDKVNLQVIGDSELYGEEYMIEPADEKNSNIIVNVNTWRPVKHIYGRRYVTWRSPYRLGYYPTWYRPWKRVSWAIYHPRVVRYHRSSYRRATVRRCHRAHRYYYSHRVHSPYFLKSSKTISIKSTKTGVTQTSNGAVVKKQTTVKNSANPTSSTKVETQKKSTQTENNHRKRPGGTGGKTKPRNTKSSRGRH